MTTEVHTDTSSHTGVFFGLISLISKFISLWVKTNTDNLVLLEVISNYIAIFSGVLGIGWILWQWLHRLRRYWKQKKGSD